MGSRLDVRGLEARCWKLDAGSERLEVRSWSLEVRGWMLDVRSWMSDVRFIILLISTFYLISPARGQSLEEYQRQALEQNPALQASYKQFEAAMQRVSQVNSLPDPTLSIGYFISPVETRVGPQRVRFSLSQMFPWFGTLKAQEDVAAIEAQVKYEEFMDASRNLTKEVEMAYYPLWENRQLIELQQENLEYLQTIKAIATARFESGEADLANVLQVDIMADQIKLEIKLLEARQPVLGFMLNKLMNRNDSTVAVADSLNLPILSDTLLQLDHHPAVTQWQLRRQAGEKRIEAIDKSGMPRLGLGLDYVLVGERSDMDVPDNGKDILMPMVTMSLPIFRKKYTAAKNEMELMNESFLLKSESVKNSLESRYSSLYNEIYSEGERARLYQSLKTQTDRVNRLVLSGFQNGSNGLAEWMEVQRMLIEYQKLYVRAVARAHIAAAELRYLMSE